MNALELFHKNLEDNNWDASNNMEINKGFLTVYDELIGNSDIKTAHLAEVERQAFAFSKTPEKRLSDKLAGEQTLEDGTKIPYEWPDIKVLRLKQKMAKMACL
ncbi:MAG: hypothetical protein ABIN01_15620 [Ferruginibacter sp.]